MKTKEWFENKLKEYKDDPEFLHEYIDLLEGEIDALKRHLTSQSSGREKAEYDPDYFDGIVPKDSDSCK